MILDLVSIVYIMAAIIIISTLLSLLVKRYQINSRGYWLKGEWIVIVVITALGLLGTTVAVITILLLEW